GDSSTISAAWGFNTDKSVFGIGIEYAEQERVRYQDRPWTNECTGNVEITESGEIRRQDLYYANLGYPDVGQCSSLSLAGRTFIGAIPSGSIYYTPGTSNGGWPNFSESGDPFLGVASDGNGDGVGYINFNDYNLNGAPSDLISDLLPKSESMNILAYGETTLDGDMNVTPYFEAMYNTYEVNQNSGEGQLFPTVPALNPYNLCNPNQPNGVDCGLAYGAYLDNPGIQQQWINTFGAPAAFFRDVLGLSFVGGTAIGPTDTLPIVSVRGDRNLVDVEMEQSRIVLGATADLPFLDIGTLSNWRGDISIAYN
ncbi:MAG: outer membrane cobalamin receptor protein, partial [Gammaproteobacteria bacterium]